MATNDSELIDEVRALTDYGEHIFSEIEMHELLQVCKEEVRADMSNPEFTFYQDDHAADRALFWFLCIATKVRVGEIGGSNISISDLDFESVQDNQANVWISNYQNRINSVGDSGRHPSSVRVDRGTERDYGSER